MNSIADHLESHLGQIAEGWGDGSSLRVVRFAGQPEPGVSAFSTLGLSRHVLSMSDGRSVRQELLLGALDRFSKELIASFLLAIAAKVAPVGKAVLRGEVLGPWRTMAEGADVNSVYATIPVMFADGLPTFPGSNPPTVVVWLIPLIGHEHEWVTSNGWDAFETRLEREGLDFFNLERESFLPRSPELD